MTLLKPIRLKDLSKDEIVCLLQRSRIDISQVEKRVKEIIERVKKYGDDEIVRFYREFYGREVLTKETISVSEEEFEKAYEKVSRELIEALEHAKNNIKVFHKRQLPPNLWSIEVERGVYAGQVWKPLDSIGVYIPSGRAIYPSTVLMTIVPAKVAGVPRIIACTPPREDGSIHPAILVALDVVGVRRVYRVGGAHAIAALAYGTETIPRVEKVIGPGGIWVTAAKRLLQGVVDIDFIAGPSEILIIADESANPQYVALDLIAQAEHDPAAAAILVATSEKLANKVAEILSKYVQVSLRKSIIEESLKKYGAIIVVDSLDEAFEFANKYAPEHIEIQVKDISLVEVLNKIRNAGSIFIGPYTPVALGDYIIGTNHVLPTTMIAKRRGGLSVYDYIKFIDFQYVTREGYRKLYRHAMILAEVEGLIEHKNSIKVRLRKTLKARKSL